MSSQRNKRRIEDLADRIEDGVSGIHFFHGEEGEDGVVLFRSSLGSRRYTRQDLNDLENRHPELILMIVADPEEGEAPPRYADDFSRPEDLYRENAYCDAVRELADAEGITFEEAEASVTDPDLLAIRAEMDDRYSRWEQWDGAHEELEEDIAPQIEEAAKRLERLNERARRQEARKQRGRR